MRRRSVASFTPRPGESVRRHPLNRRLDGPRSLSEEINKLPLLGNESRFHGHPARNKVLAPPRCRRNWRFYTYFDESQSLESHKQDVGPLHILYWTLTAGFTLDGTALPSNVPTAAVKQGTRTILHVIQHIHHTRHTALSKRLYLQSTIQAELCCFHTLQTFHQDLSNVSSALLDKCGTLLLSSP
jgi:hypothetical protein